MRRKSERNKTSSTSSPDKVKKVTRRGRKSTATADESTADEEKQQQSEDEQQSQHGDSSDAAEEEPVVRGRKKLTRGATKSDDKEERPSRSRRKTAIAQPKIETVREENSEHGENGEQSINDVDNKQVEEDESEPMVVVESSSLDNKSSDSPKKQRTQSPEKSPSAVKQRSQSPADVEDKVSSPQKVVELETYELKASPDTETEPAVSSTEDERAKSPEIETERTQPAEQITNSPTTKEPSSVQEEEKPEQTESSQENTKTKSSSKDQKNTQCEHQSISSEIENTNNAEVVVQERTKRNKSRFSSPSPMDVVKPFQETSKQIDAMDVDKSLEDERFSKVSSTTDEPKLQLITSLDSNKIKEADKKSRSEKENKEKRKYDEKIVEKKSKPLRKRKWLTQKSVEAKPQILAISTDSLKNLISDVKPVPLSDVKLESSPEPEEVEIIVEKEIAYSTAALPPAPSTSSSKRKTSRERERTRRRERSATGEDTISPKNTVTVTAPGGRATDEKSSTRKVLLVNDGPAKVARPPSPAKFNSTNILYITNLVRPFTVLQLKGLLARTGKIVENGFWIDKIKSKCYVKYETEE